MNKTRYNIYTVVFAAILGLVCALLLTAVAQVTRVKQEENRKAEEIRNILTALKVSFDSQAGTDELIAVFKRDVIVQTLGQKEPLTLYIYKPEGSDAIAAVAVRFTGPGLWGPVKGFLALEPDYKTIRGITFYEQEETPGLGGEIVTEDFRRRFEGKQIVNEQGDWGIEITVAGGEQTGMNEVAGISGATMTCDKVEEMINAIIQTLAEKRKADGR